MYVRVSVWAFTHELINELIDIFILSTICIHMEKDVLMESLCHFDKKENKPPHSSFVYNCKGWKYLVA